MMSGPWTESAAQTAVMNVTSSSSSSSSSPPPASLSSLVVISLLFCVIGVVGLVGNLLVVVVVVVDRVMRRSVTNLVLVNLAVADLLIMCLGVPEIVQFMMNRGWVLGVLACKTQRYGLVAALYASIMSLTTVAVERYIAIVHPIRAHIACSRRRILAALALVWCLALTLAAPTALFNQVTPGGPPGSSHLLCRLVLPGPHLVALAVRATEFTVFFLTPVLVQIVLYTILSRKLFSGSAALHRKRTVLQTDGAHKEKDAEAIRTRKGVVKMLIGTVLVYVVSYAPAQAPLVYSLIWARPFTHSWSFLALVMTLGYVNSAANPILYSIFSHNFRRAFVAALCRGRRGDGGRGRQRGSSGGATYTGVGGRSSRGTLLTTAISETAPHEEEEKQSAGERLMMTARTTVIDS